MAGGRRKARREALFLLYQADLMGVPVNEAIRRAEAGGGALDPYSFELVTGVSSCLERLDRLISEHLEGWTMTRVAPLERSILRLAAFEMTVPGDVPAAVAIDEAVELAKRYCSDEAAALVNGVLGAVQRAGEEQAAREDGA